MPADGRDSAVGRRVPSDVIDNKVDTTSCCNAVVVILNTETTEVPREQTEGGEGA